MGKKVLGVVGSYRKGGIVDSLVDEVLSTAEKLGARTTKTYLIDRHIEFCTNCRGCMQSEGAKGCREDDVDVARPQLPRSGGGLAAPPTWNRRIKNGHPSTVGHDSIVPGTMESCPTDLRDDPRALASFENVSNDRGFQDRLPK